ncbi:MAG: hypothetical protein CTY34_05470 [Methylobacter sp.]|nr:MAG: hypothetical protein CTY34_05470 [Methylobacter sp.]PPD17453.1 MAG: hypothetical protein CTY24_14855 [Methylobacter sp.]PPD36143.1 MAG: hypothetical protein CTY18_05675 [Methylomonas sp.]
MFIKYLKNIQNIIQPNKDNNKYFEKPYKGHADQWFGGNTYAQHGEDIFLLNIFRLLKIDKPNYLDIGAHHPINISNTALLYKFGSRGVNVEANPNLIELFLQIRPEDKTINVGVSDLADEMNFYMIDDYSGRNTFEKLEADKFVTENPGFKITKVLKIKVITINEIVRNFFWKKPLDFLTIDVEGLDERIIRSLDFNLCRPKIICIETVDAVGNYNGKLKDFICENSYESLVHMGGNTLFADKSYIGLLR